MLLRRATKNKNTAKCHSREQKTAFLELSLKLAPTSSLQWFNKITFLDSTYVQLKDYIAECVTLESHKKQEHWWLSQQGIEHSFFKAIFRIGFALSLQWYNKLTFSYCTYVTFKGFIAECVTLESHVKQKHWWILQQGTENKIFKIIF